MERAGLAAADFAATLMPDGGKDILVLAGPGNNGGDARIVARILDERFFRVTLASAADAQSIPALSWALVIDGLFGIGLAREISGDYAKLIDYANAQSCPVLALDIPRGLASVTGPVLAHALRATPTLPLT